MQIIWVDVERRVECIWSRGDFLWLKNSTNAVFDINEEVNDRAGWRSAIATPGVGPRLGYVGEAEYRQADDRRGRSMRWLSSARFNDNIAIFGEQIYL